MFERSCRRCLFPSLHRRAVRERRARSESEIALPIGEIGGRLGSQGITDAGREPGEGHSQQLAAAGAGKHFDGEWRRDFRIPMVGAGEEFDEVRYAIAIKVSRRTAAGRVCLLGRREGPRRPLGVGEVERNSCWGATQTCGSGP